uniref:Zinc finger BED domain-containing protein 4 n=1 Tax=Globodera pallida TaxID=36090 RepID=A0A183C515_GLOPA
MKSILEKCRRTISHFNHSNLAKERLEDAQTQEKLPRHALIQDVPTRWNSSYLMGERLTEQRRALELYVFKYKPNFCILDDEEWTILAELCSLLRPVEEASRKIAIANILLGELTEKNYPIIEEEQKKLISEIRERFSNLESKRIYAVAHYLDPRFKDQFVPNRLEFVSKILSWINLKEPIRQRRVGTRQIGKEKCPKSMKIRNLWILESPGSQQFQFIIFKIPK